MREYQKSVSDISQGVHTFFCKVFTRFVVDGPAIDFAELTKHPVMIPCTHRSQADYFVLGQTVFDWGLRNMRFAAGENLTGLPFIGPKFTSLGAFSVKRESTLGRNYVRNLCDQVAAMLRNDDSIIVFPEGGRSYSGGMLDLKSGILASAILATARAPQHPVYMLPCAISYEQLPELLYFDMLGSGKKLRSSKNPLSRMVGSMKYFGADIIAFCKFLLAPRFGRKYGAIYIDYERPIPVTDLVDIEHNRIENARDEFSAHRASMQILSSRMHEHFIALYRILPSHVLARTLLDRRQRTLAELGPLCRETVENCTQKGRNVTSVLNLSDDELVSLGVQQLKTMKGIRIKNSTISIRRRSIVDYYAATIA